MPQNTFESVIQRMVDPRRPDRFIQEKSSLFAVQVLAQKGFLDQASMAVLLNIVADYLSSKGY